MGTKEIIHQKVVNVVVDDISLTRGDCSFPASRLLDLDWRAFIDKFDIYPICKSLID